MPTYEWYEKIAQFDSFEQGDFFDDIPIIVPSRWDVDENAGNPALQALAERHNLVLMTQSCDLIKYNESDQVLLCPRLDYVKAKEKQRSFEGTNGWRNLVAGRIVGAHILNKSTIEGHRFDYQIVDMRRVFSLPIEFLKGYSRSHAASRIRLLPPYREHLAQAFARQFMRVGLPIDLPREYPGADG